MKSDTDMARKRLATVQEYKAVFNSPVGKKVLYDLMRVGHIMAPFISTDPQEMAVKEGERRMVIRILNILKTDQNKLIDAIKEGERNG